MLTIKCSGGGKMIWACFVATETGHVAVTDLTVKSSVYQSILETNVKPSVWQLKLGFKLGHATG